MHPLERGGKPGEIRQESIDAPAIFIEFGSKLFSQVGFLRQGDGHIGEGEKGQRDDQKPKRAGGDPQSHENEKVAHVKRVSAMGEHAPRHQLLRIDLAISATADDVIEPDRDRPQDLADRRNHKSRCCHSMVVSGNEARFDEKEKVGQWKQAIAVMKEKIADPGHHLTAIIPEKLYHLKNTSQYRKPARMSSSRFSSSL